MHPSRETAERGEVVVGCCRSKPLSLEGALPSEYVTLEKGTDMVMSVTLGKEVGETVEVQGDLLGHGRGAHADHGEDEVARHPRRERVRNGIRKGIGEARHLS